VASTALVLHCWSYKSEATLWERRHGTGVTAHETINISVKGLRLSPRILPELSDRSLAHSNYETPFSSVEDGDSQSKLESPRTRISTQS
jgi:hypothetical protein